MEPRREVKAENVTARATVTLADPGMEVYRGRTPGPYVPGTSWRTWWKLFLNFLTLRKVTEERDQRLIFLQEVGNANYELLESLLQGRELEEVELHELRTAMEKHYQPRKLVLAERFGLMSLVQKPGQALHEFYAELQKAANSCSFDTIKNHRDAFVTMVFIGGLASVETRKRLLEKEELTSKEALEQAEAFERVGANAPHLKEGPQKIGVAQVRMQKGNDVRRGTGRSQIQEKRVKPDKGPVRDRRRCWVCGAPGHVGHDCFRKDRAYCKVCRKKGHYAVVCKAADRRKVSRQVHWCVEPPGCSDSENEITNAAINGVYFKTQTHCRRAKMDEPVRQSLQDEEMTLRATQSAKEEESDSGINGLAAEPPRMLQMEANGQIVPFELDTGASMSIIDEKTWYRLGQPRLKETQVAATAYNNERIKLQGKVNVEVKFAGKTARLDLHVFKDATHSLCGRDMIQALQIDCGPHYNRVHKVVEMSKVELKNEVIRLLNLNKELFQAGLGRCTTTQAELKFKNGEPRPKFFRARPVPIALRPKVEAKLEELVQNGTLRRVEHTEWATPLVVVPKPGGKVRICGDYKVTVNPQLDINQYPLPKPDDLFHMLNGGKKFSKLDLKDAYMQVELKEEFQKYTTINTHKGLFQYTRVPFGIASAPAIFQKIMETTLAGIEGVLIYLDDITVTGPDDRSHLQRLEKVLKRLREAGFRLKREKCEFLKQEMEFLGHVVDANGIRPSPSKLKAMINMPEPKNIKETESYLGMVQYYGKFIPQLATLAAPLNALRRKGVPWKWDEEQRKAFQAIREKLTATETLAHYNPDVPVVLATDASEYGLGAVLYHKYEDGTEKVIAYASRSLTKEERNYAQIEKEALGIVYGVEKFNQFLYGRRFTLLTDHQPLVRIFGPKQGLPIIAAKRLHRWGLRLMVYSFDIEYRKTEDFGNADGLSRLPDPRELPSAEMVVDEVRMQQRTEEVINGLPMTEKQIAQATKEDKVLKMVERYICEGWPLEVKDSRLKPFAAKKTELSLYRGCILWDNRVVIPDRYKAQVLKILHNSHYGRNRMVSLARMKVWFPGIDAAIERVAKGCHICAALGKDPVRTPLHPWEEPEKVWQRLHIDFCDANGSKWLIVVDAKSKWPEVIRMGSTTAERTIAKLKEIFSRNGLPEQLVSDNGPPFSSKFFREYCENRGIEQIFTPPYHPNSNGEAERFVQTFKTTLYKGLRSRKTEENSVWDLLFEYRVTPHVATGKSPAEMLQGRNLRTTLDVIKTGQRKNLMSRYTAKMKQQYDKGKRERKFRIGQEVYIRNYSGTGDRWIPGIIVKTWGTNTYEVNMGTGQRKVHADQLKERIMKWEEVEDYQLQRMDEKRKGAHNESEMAKGTGEVRRSTRKRKETERMREYMQDQKKRRINKITLERIKDDNGELGYISGELEYGGSSMWTPAAMPWPVAAGGTGQMVASSTGPPAIIMMAPQAPPP
ncbi:unnamed protein product, partial [Nippostrongylus brasiliensis]|uniref:RNA-directed DNA polymerase n=1 Tax=Nippostrongylus brasiliensis TaxID=27835 RepID=A0A0N4XIH9_NIPBR